jgi:predicted transcriptional regulator
MTEDRSTKLSFRLDTAVYTALEKLAAEHHYEPMAYIQRVLAEHALTERRDHLTPEDATRITNADRIIALAVERSIKLYKQGLFTEDFVLTVFRSLMADPTSRELYEKAIGGKAYEMGVPGKSPLNMYLGWYIKNAVPADPQTLPNGKPVRVAVKNEPIQSYTRLVLKEGEENALLPSAA